MTRGPTATKAGPSRGPAWRRFAGSCGALVAGAVGAPLALALCLGASAGAASSSSLSHFALQSNEEPGYTVGGHPSTYTTPSGLLEGGSLTKSQMKSAVSTLQKAGFVKAVEEATMGSVNNEGFSLVMEFRNAAGAQTGAALFLHLAQTGQAGTKPFSVAGVPGAQGVTVTGSAGGSANAYWSAGDCAFGSGVYDGTATSAKAAASPVRAGIKSQAKRIGTTCP